MKTIYNKLFFLVLLLPFSAIAQEVLSGTVFDKTTGQPLPGVNVVVKGTTNGTSTDFDGKFKLTKVTKGATIMFSFVGYNESSIVYNAQSSINISLEESASQLNEVVVQVGYGSVKKKDATGSITTVTQKDFNRGANVTAENLLNGRVAGLTINTSGAPGSGSQIRIRGGGSLNATNDPLVVVDGLPISNTANTGSTSFLASLNPNIIESISVLKDASATAIYGSRASNGVIIITTKKGGKTLSAEYNVQYGAGKLIKTVDVFSADEFRQLIKDRKTVDVNTLGTANTNWQEEIYRKTEFIDNNLTVSGSLFGALPTRLTLGKTYQEGLRLTNAFERNTVNLAMNPTLFKDHLKIRLNANYTNENNRFTEGVEGTAIRFDPTRPVRSNGPGYEGFFEYYNPTPNANGSYSLLANTPRNPVAQLLQTNDTGLNNRVFGNIELDYKFHFFPALRGVVNLGFDESNGRRTKNVSKNAASSGTNNNIPFGTNEFTEEQRRNKLLDAYLVYNRTSETFNFDFTGGYSYQKFEVNKFETGNINNPNLPPNFPETTLDTDVVLIGLFARTNLSYKDKYLLTLSYRRDGTSRFSKENRWGNFPAVAFAWKVKEDFFKETKVLSDLKLRLGYGITGQQEIGAAANDYLQKYNLGSGSSQYYFGPLATPISVSSRLSPDLKWEEAVTYNAGIDYGFFDNRITGAIDVYYKDTKDLLVDAAVSDGSNFSNRAYQNVGSFTTKGIEFSINVNVLKSDNLNWDINFNATKFERRLTELIYNNDIFVGDNIAGTANLGQIFSDGYTPYSFYVFKQLYDTNNRPIEGAYADLNQDGIVNDSDRYIYKNPDPDATFGFASNFNYRNLDFSFNLRASIGNRVLNAVNAGGAQYAALQSDAALGNIPKAVLETNFNTTADVSLSDIYVENASFLRMDNITLGYSFPKWLEGKASLRLFTGVQNAFLITKYSGLDPEITNNGVDKTIYPRQRTLLFGANIKF
jgi:iron complex outermembrane receptor protein